MTRIKERPEQHPRIGNLPLWQLAPRDYRYALDAAMPTLAVISSPMVRCHVPQLATEVRQRIPCWHESGLARAGLWAEPLQDSWVDDLRDLGQALEPGSPLIVVASQPLARLLPERRDWPGQPLGYQLGGVSRLLRALHQAGFAIEEQHGIHSLAAITINRVGSLLQRMGRPELRDRLEFAVQLRYCTNGPVMGFFSTVALIFARRQPNVHRTNRVPATETGQASGSALDGLPGSSLSQLPRSTPGVQPSALSLAVSRLDAWLETMRCPGGYGGPVVHWWQQALLYTGRGLDWRYEGIISGYLQLWRRTGDERWLLKARRAGDNLLAGQLPNGNFSASAFEINLAAAGTPHEAACDVGLLLLARALRDGGWAGWQRYATCAERNLRAFYVEQLWDPQTRSFADSPVVPTFVPNKAATACEALFMLAEISGHDRWVEQYALPTLNRILGHQVQDAGALDGAIAQNTFRGQRVDKYFPIYIARCIPALLQAYEWTNDARYAESAQRAMAFIARQAYPDGSFPTVVYPDQRANRYPSWIAPLADILRSADQLQAYGFDRDLSASRERLLAGQDESGGIQTAHGFAAQTGGRPPKVPDVRDVLHVVGWCDKVFRYLTSHVDSQIPEAASTTFETACSFRGQEMQLVETPQALQVSREGRICYRWRKGERWPEVATQEFWLR